MALTVCGLSAFGQGYFTFGGGPGSVWDGSPGGSTRGPAVYNVAFLWGTGTPLVDTATIYNAGAAWAAILTDPIFQFAFNANSDALVVAATTANGSFSYNGATTFPVTGTAAGGGSTTMYLIAWLAADGSTPAAAAAAGSPMGWSNPFTYAYTSSIGTPPTLAMSGFLPFGAAPIPEPSTLALAGLGSLSLLLFRRRK